MLPRWSHDANLSFLLGLLGILLFMPLPFVGQGMTQLLFDIILTAVLVSACYIVSRPRWLVVLTVVLTAIGISLQWGAFATDDPRLGMSSLAVSALVLVLISIQVMRWVLGPGMVTGHRIRGAVLVYLLLGLTWALAYTLAELIEPGSFHFVDGTAAVVGSRNQLFAELNYFSFVTLLTVGYGDITPVGETVRKLALLEGLFGQLFPVVVIGRMVSLELEAELMSNIDRKP